MEDVQHLRGVGHLEKSKGEIPLAANWQVTNWVYYLLGVKNVQYGVYCCFELDSGATSPLIPCMGGDSINPSTFWKKVAFWNTEYNTYGAGSLVNVKMKFDSLSWKKFYNFNDYLGNVNLVLDENKNIVSYNSYAPFGEAITDSSNDRQTFIGKEKDRESGLGDFGVRKYDEGGRFTSIDPLWEKYYSWSPYHYCRANPVSRIDNNGYVDEFTMTLTQCSAKSNEEAKAYLDAYNTAGAIYLGAAASVAGTMLSGGALAASTGFGIGEVINIVGLGTGAYNFSKSTVQLIGNAVGKGDEVKNLPDSPLGLVGAGIDAATKDQNKTAQKVGDVLFSVLSIYPNLKDTEGNALLRLFSGANDFNTILNIGTDFIKGQNNNKKAKTDEKSKYENLTNPSVPTNNINRTIQGR